MRKKIIQYPFSARVLISLPKVIRPLGEGNFDLLFSTKTLKLCNLKVFKGLTTLTSENFGGQTVFS